MNLGTNPEGFVDSCFVKAQNINRLPVIFFDYRKRDSHLARYLDHFLGLLGFFVN